MRKIKIVNGTYGYRPAPAVVEPKTPEDPAFFVEDQQAARLVALGVAAYVGEAPEMPAAPDEPAPDAPAAPEAPAEESEPETPAAPDYTVVQLDGMDYNALKALAAKRGVKPAGQKKIDYIAALMAADVEVEDDGDELPELTAADPE